MLREKWVLLTILLLAAAFRLVALRDVPPGLSQDEVLDTGMPAFILDGNHALFFRQGYGHEPLYHYLGIPFYLAFGENYLQARLPSVFLGLLLVAATMRWAKRASGFATAVAAGLGLAISWWPIIFSRIGIRPIMEPLFLVGAAWFWQKKPWLAGLLLGLSLYSYTAAQVMLAWPVLWTAVHLCANRHAWKSTLTNGAIVLGTAVLVALPLYLTWWADPSLLQRADQLSGPLDALRGGDVQPILAAALNTSGVFSFAGDPRWTYGPPGRPLFDPLTALLFYAGLFVALLRIRQFPYALLLTWLVAGLLPSMLTPQSPSTIRLIGALPAVYVIIGIAAAWLVSVFRHANYGLRLTVYGLLITLFLFNTTRTVRDGFLAWPAAVETRLNHYPATLLEMVRHWQAEPAGTMVITDPFFEQIDAESLQRNAGAPIEARWVEAAAMVFPGGGSNGRLYIPEYAPLSPVLVDLLDLPATPLYRSRQTPVFAVYHIPPLPAIPPLPEPVLFAGLITLEGYALLPTADPDLLYLCTRWRVEQALPPNLTAFTHLLDAQGELAAQDDAFNVAAAELQPGDIVLQLHTISAPAANGPFTLQVGLYIPSENRRLTLAGQTADALTLTQGFYFDGK